MLPFSVDTAAIARDWQTARDSIASVLTAKQSAPLDQITLPDEARVATEIYVGQRQRIAVLNEELQQANVSIAVIKERAQEGSPTAIATDLERLRAVKARFTPNTASLCKEYLTELAAKTETETHRDAARAELETYRNSVFPGFETAINLYLQRFNAGFRIAEMTPENTRGGSTCTYNVIINNTPVHIAGQTPPGEPAFRNTLSAGDRNTLALAFFFASLDQNQSLEIRLKSPAVTR